MTTRRHFLSTMLVEHTTTSASTACYEPCSILALTCGYRPPYQSRRRRSSFYEDYDNSDNSDTVPLTVQLIAPYSPTNSTLSIHSSFTEEEEDDDEEETMMDPPPVAADTETPPPQKQSAAAADLLFEKMADYQSRGLISHRDYQHYHALLEKHSTSDFFLHQISKDIDDIVTTRREQEEAQSKASSHQPASILLKSNNNKSAESSYIQRNNRHVSWEDQESSRFEDELEEVLTDEQDVSSLILEPADIWRGAVQFTEQQLHELFVEMCFFARLGYLEPPCCLQCTYRESINKQVPNTDCNQWVVWRKNAQTLLHPNRLDGNILIVKCHVARKLMAGECVEGRIWDKEKKQVITEN